MINGAIRDDEVVAFDVPLQYLFHHMGAVKDSFQMRPRISI